MPSTYGPEPLRKARIIAMWESRGRKDYVDLLESNVGYGWSGTAGMGWFGNEPLEGVLRIMQERTAAGAQFFCSQKSAMEMTYASDEVLSAMNGGVKCPCKN